MWMMVVLTPAPIAVLALFNSCVTDPGRLSGLFGLVLNVVGAAIIALPDVPRLNQYALPKGLRRAWQTLQDERHLTPNDVGFNSIVDLINRKNGRLSHERTCNFLNIDYKIYGNPSISAGFEEEEGKPPRYTVANWITMQTWIEDHRDNVRASGFIIFMFGFAYQMLGYVL